jgi:hypothetical protein
MGNDLTLAIRVSREWAGGQPPRDPATRPAIAGRIHAVVNPLLRMVAWPRWLFLERALLDASATGDLLFAALVLRTMCEEALRLHALDIDGERLVRLAASSAPADQERVILFFSIACASLDDLPQEMVLDGVGWPSPPRTAMPRLDKARMALNSYVHPNYGSHIARSSQRCIHGTAPAGGSGSSV